MATISRIGTNKHKASRLYTAGEGRCGLNLYSYMDTKDYANAVHLGQKFFFFKWIKHIKGYKLFSVTDLQTLSIAHFMWKNTILNILSTLIE
jgi:hypothetical protein